MMLWVILALSDAIGHALSRQIPENIIIQTLSLPQTISRTTITTTTLAVFNLSSKIQYQGATHPHLMVHTATTL